MSSSAWREGGATSQGGTLSLLWGTWQNHDQIRITRWVYIIVQARLV